MPIPTPNAGESQDDFIGRCMGNPTMRREYSDQKQRAAVCHSQWRRKKGTDKEEKAMSGQEATSGGTMVDETGKGQYGGESPKQRRRRRRKAKRIAARSGVTIDKVETLIIADPDTEIDDGKAREGGVEKSEPDGKGREGETTAREGAVQIGPDTVQLADPVACEYHQAYEFAKVQDEPDFTFVLGPVLVPDKIDKQGDVVQASEIEIAAHGFIENDGRSGLLHQMMLKKRDAIVVESFIVRGTLEIGKQSIDEGTWMVAMKVYKPELRKLIKEGKLKGYSVGGRANAQAVA